MLKILKCLKHKVEIMFVIKEVITNIEDCGGPIGSWICSCLLLRCLNDLIKIILFYC